jgi:hypothetical protein
VSRSAEHDPCLIINLGANAEVVGAQVLDVMGLPVDVWQVHPDRDELPSDMFDAIWNWLKGHGH